MRVRGRQVGFDKCLVSQCVTTITCAVSKHAKTTSSYWRTFHRFIGARHKLVELGVRFESNRSLKELNRRLHRLRGIFSEYMPRD